MRFFAIAQNDKKRGSEWLKKEGSDAVLSKAKE
jgi:hypothetical protein